MRNRREPSAELRQVANDIHERYTALVDAGFSRREALTLVSALLTAPETREEGDE